VNCSTKEKKKVGTTVFERKSCWGKKIEQPGEDVIQFKLWGRKFKD